MAFLTNVKLLRTWDPERNLELKLIGGSSDGSSYFRLDSPLGSYEFAADEVFEPDPLADPADKQPLNRLVWRVRWHGSLIPGRDAAETTKIIREALTAYKGVHGIPERQAVRVELEPASSVRAI